jgi:hypothetical protein
LRTNDVEQLQADGRDAAEVAWSRGALATRVADLDPRVETLRIHLLGRRCEHEVDAGFLRE